MSDLSVELLDRPAEEVVRIVAIALLDEASASATRLGHPEENNEALHDFRVAVRRLRTWLRTFRDQLGGLGSKRARRALGDLARGTNTGRDAEVQLEWLRSQSDLFSTRDRVGYTWLIDWLEARREESYASARGEIVRAFSDIAEKLRHELATLTITVHLAPDGREPSEEGTFREVALGAIKELHATLKAQLREIDGPNAEEGHEARISAKRLRYVVEPLAAEFPHAAELVKHLKGVQDVLGEMHDMQLLGADIGKALEVAAAGRARRLHNVALKRDPDSQEMRAELRRDERPGLIFVARRVKDTADRRYRDLEQRYLKRGAGGIHGAVAGLIAALEEKGRESVEIERKYLLKKLPPNAKKATRVRIEQGWIPGEKLHERVRRATADGREVYYRTVKLGRGLKRVEVEEETTAEIFEVLWPLTEGKRVHKTRYLIEEGKKIWEVDAFEDRELFLAEIELEDEKEEVELPRWLAPYVEREVTDDSEYTNINLAR